MLYCNGMIECHSGCPRAPKFTIGDLVKGLGVKDIGVVLGKKASRENGIGYTLEVHWLSSLSLGRWWHPCNLQFASNTKGAVE